jgi:tetratricopeptide (TPR) repeat protein
LRTSARYGSPGGSGRIGELRQLIGYDMASEETSPNTPEKPDKDGELGLPQLTPAKRKRLQQAFEAANNQMRQGQHDYAHELFTQCVLGDPANAAYVQSFLANLKQKYNNNKKGNNMAALTGIGARAKVKAAVMKKDWLTALQRGLDCLKLNPWHVGTLRHLGHACNELGCLDSQLWFLNTAREFDPKDPDVNRECAIVLKDKKQYDQAIACWHRVEQARPGNEEAERAIASLSVEKTIVEGKYGEQGGGGKVMGKAAARSDSAELTPEQRLERDIRRNPKDLTKYVELSELYIREELFAKAAEILTRAVDVSGGDLEIRERLEDVEMRQLRQLLAKADQQFQQTGNDADKRRAEDCKRQVFEKDLEMYQGKVERYPNNLAFKFELGLRYQVIGKCNEAIAEFQGAQNDPRRKGLCLLGLGECFQHVKKYNLAMDHFEKALAEIPDRDADNRKKTLYRAGKLAAALGHFDVAERHLATLAGMDFSYRDVSALLDKIGEIRKNRAQGEPAPDSQEA